MVRLADVYEGRDDALSHSGTPGRFFVWLPVGHALRKVRRYLRQANRVFQNTASGAIAIDAPAGCPEALVVDLIDLLTDDESADTRCVFKTGRADLNVEDIRRVRTIRQLRQRQTSQWLLEMLRSERFTSVFQPIVRADETSNVLGHEAFVRGIGRDGRTVLPDSLFDTARGCGMLPELDSAARRSAIREASITLDDRRHLFVNVTAEALNDGIETLASTIVAIDEAEILRERVVFEVIDTGRAADVRKLRAVVESVRGVGFRVALDDVGCDERSLRVIHEVRPDFVKLDMGHVRFAVAQRDDAQRVLELAQHLKIETIAESVETSDELEWNREYGATYVQGYFIARPAAITG